LPNTIGRGGSNTSMFMKYEKKPSYGFGSSRRPDYINKNSPGPGAYKVPGTVAARPSYETTN
jgi:hypothetical protein